MKRRFIWILLAGSAVTLFSACSDDTQSENKPADSAIASSHATMPDPTPSTVQPAKLPEKGENCMVAACSAGEKIISTGSKNDKYYVCQTRQTAAYVTMVMGLVQLQKALTGSMPNISPETGEPEYEGKTKEMIDDLRTEAGVKTLDEAINNYCTPGKPGHRYIVMNNPSNEQYIWAGDIKHNQAFWFPKSAVKPM